MVIFAWAVLIIIAFVAFKLGKESGYQIGFNSGYRKCCKDYKIEDNAFHQDW
jgi:hypothetical protein